MNYRYVLLGNSLHESIYSHTRVKDRKGSQELTVIYVIMRTHKDVKRLKMDLEYFF